MMNVIKFFNFRVGPNRDGVESTLLSKEAEEGFKAASASDNLLRL